MADSRPFSLVNNAAISFEARRGFQQTHETALGEFDKTHHVNVRGTFLACKYGLDQMLKQEPTFGPDRGWSKYH
jgi:NAD(P)-dependent dehydrogenase (short-subunit alcohol dehydrogenase family)